ncbi:MAG: hypothetical protein QF578_08675 [Alphaproteobacteria bacterium]|nr:hypothetical protein [Alphaproteobacteria bacterium]MDP6564885.1 hypothetical protein [Alphaproteobacteria bacterium]MDP6811875.1 hypothetical protein [Alphaproteobacteria bacterium]
MAAKPWLLLPVETKAREFHAKLLLAAVAAEDGFEVLLGEQNAMLHQLRHLPRGLYIDKSIARSKTAHFRRLRQRGNRVAAWCEEGLVYRDKTSYLHERICPESLAEADLFFCWGAVQQQDVAENIDQGREKLVATGNPRFDLLRPGYRDLFAAEARALRERYGDFILINTNFARYNHFNGENFLIEVQRQRGAITTAEQEAFFVAWRDFLGELYRGFAAMLAPLAGAFPERKIILRPHPSENHGRWAEECRDLGNVEVVFEGNVVPWLIAGEVLIHNSCTTGLEGYLLDRPVIAYQPATSEVYDSYLPNVVSERARVPEQLVDCVRRALDGDGASGGAEGRAAAERYYAGIDGLLASERVLAAVHGIDLPVPERPGPTTSVARAASHVGGPARRLARQALRPQMAAYARQKFPGIEIGEVRAELRRLQSASGRFADVAAEPLAHRCYRIAA